MLEDEFEFAYTTVCPRCGFEIGYDDFPPKECPDCGLSINMPEDEFAYVTICQRCGAEIGYDEYPPNECPDCGLSLGRSRPPLAGDGGGSWACPKCSHENDAMAIKCFFCDAAAPKA